METSQIVWLVLVAAFVVLEASTAVLVSVWFCVGALAALAVSLIWPGAYPAQALVFVAVSLATLPLLRPVARRLIDGRRVATNADANIGGFAEVTKDVLPGRFGRARLRGQDWTVVSAAEIKAGAWCRVLAIEGVKLVVEPAEAPGKKTEGER